MQENCFVSVLSGVHQVTQHHECAGTQLVKSLASAFISCLTLGLAFASRGKAGTRV